MDAEISNVNRAIRTPVTRDSMSMLMQKNLSVALKS